MPLERVQDIPNNDPTGHGVDVRRFRPEVKSRIEQQNEDSLATLREFLDKLEHSKAAETIKKVIREQIRTAVVRQGQPSVRAYESGTKKGGDTLLELSESWMDVYLMSHARMQDRYSQGQINAVDLYKMILRNALMKAGQSAKGKEAADLKEAGELLDQFLGESMAVDFSTMEAPARLMKIYKDSKELRQMADKIIEENGRGKGPFVKEINGYKFSIVNGFAIVEVDITKDGQTIHLDIEDDGGVLMSKGPAVIAGYTPQTGQAAEKAERPDLLGPKLDQFVALLRQSEHATEAEVREF